MKKEKKEAKLEVKRENKQMWNFPRLGKSVKASSYEEALKIINKSSNK